MFYVFFLQRVDYPRWLLFLFSPQCCLIRKGHPSLVLMPASPHKQHSTNSRPSPILLMMEIFFLGQTGASLVMIKTHCTGHYLVTLSDFPQHFWGDLLQLFFLLAVNLTRGGGYFTISNKIIHPFPVLTSFDGLPRLDS